MKLNEDWDQVYRSATLSLQHRLETLELENSAIKQLNSRLLLKVEHQQVNTRKYLHMGDIVYIHTDPKMWVFGDFPKLWVIVLLV